MNEQIMKRVLQIFGLHYQYAFIQINTVHYKRYS